MLKNRSKSGMTLMELIISIVLLSMLVMVFVSIDLFGRYHLILTDRRSRIQGEATIAMQHMTRNISLGVGDAINPATVAPSNSPAFLDGGGTGIRVRVNGNPPNYAGANWIGYNQVGNALRFYAVDNAPPGAHSGNFEVIANNLITIPGGLTFALPAINQVNITVTTRQNPAAAASADNTEATLSASVIMPSVSTN